jgi:pyruvate/2-oxoglutarate dehydrogenase complex dihydrolipoamide dehydrogenase (E3) component
MAEQVDIVVLGLGVGGEAVAGALAEAGLTVVGIEHRLVGGECPYWGCVPTKMMIRAGNLLADARRVDGMAGRAAVSADWTPVARRIRDEATDTWDDKAAVDRFTGKGGRFVRGSGRLVAPGTVAVGDLVFEARRGVVLATGTEPAVPPVPGLADTPLWTNREAVQAETPPRSLLVLGGGSIGVELAQVFARFGVAVSLLEQAERLIAFEEPESSALAAQALRSDGVEVITGTSAAGVEHGADGFRLILTDGSDRRGERLLVCAGRRARLDRLGLNTIGLDPRAAHLSVDERMRVTDGVWAVGDVTGRGAYTHVATYQADLVVADILGRDAAPADYRALPRVTFLDPEIAAVGLTEEQARDRGLTVHTGLSEVPRSARGWIHKAGNDGFIKLVVDADLGLLVGATSAGPVGGEVLSALAVAVHAEVPVDRLRTMIYAYPTFHRGIQDALSALP